MEDDRRERARSESRCRLGNPLVNIIVLLLLSGADEMVLSGGWMLVAGSSGALLLRVISSSWRKGSCLPSLKLQVKELLKGCGGGGTLLEKCRGEGWWLMSPSSSLLTIVHQVESVAEI